MSERRDCPELLADSNFRSLLREMARRCMPWEEFLGLAQPHDMSPLETWHVLNDVSHCLAVPINLPDLDDNVYWYRRTHEIDDATHAIECACRPDSRLHRIMTATAGEHFVVKSRTDETIAAAQLDGLAISEEDANILLRLHRTPQSTTEHLLVNTFYAFDHLPDLIDEPFSREMFMHMRDILLAGVDASALHHQAPLLGILVGVSVPDDERRQYFTDLQMDRIAAYLNRETSDRDDVPVLQALLIADVMRIYHPFDVVSSQVGRLAARLFALKNNLPVLGLLPISRAKVDWERGLIAPPMVSFDQDMYVTLRQRSPLDSTARQTLAAQLTLITLKDLALHIETWERRDEETREVLRKDPLLNQRQRSILARALRDPEAEFRIHYHQTNHNIHYTTARRDLLELLEKGYLLMEKRGKVFVFLRGPRIDEIDTSHTS